MNELQTAKLVLINNQYQKILSSITSDTPDFEITTWQKQEKEARLYIKVKDTNPNLNNICPLLNKIALSRNVNLNDLANKVIDKANIYWFIYGKLTGLRQKAEDDIKTKEIQEELDKIKLEFDLVSEIAAYKINIQKQIPFIQISKHDEILNHVVFYNLSLYDKYKFELTLTDSNKQLNNIFYDLIDILNKDKLIPLDKNLSSNAKVKKVLNDAFVSNDIKNAFELTQTNFYKSFDKLSIALLDFANKNIF